MHTKQKGQKRFHKQFEGQASSDRSHRTSIKWHNSPKFV